MSASDEKDNTLLGQSLPDEKTLAWLAAQPRFTKFANAVEAVEAALSLWSMAHHCLDDARERERWYAEQYGPLDGIESPWEFPVSLDEFLRLIVPGKDQGERLGRYRQFVQARLRMNQAMGDYAPPDEKPSTEEDVLGMASAKIEKLKKAKLDFKKFHSEMYLFLRWWQQKVKDDKKRGGKARAAKSASLKQASGTDATIPAIFNKRRKKKSPPLGLSN
jgi:hypothetical protein